jgi:polysaccharide export outer membrane protein
VPPAHATTTIDAYHIGVDDIVQVSVWRNPELGITVPVRPDGKITVPLVGDVDAGGRTPSEVAADIQEKLGTYVRDPQVAVILTDLRSHEYLSRIRVTGAVKQPISIPYRQGMTVLDAVLAAGGTSEFAAPDRTDLYRKDDGGSTQRYPVRLDQILGNGDLSTNFPVAPGDVITVPERIL